MDVQLTQKDSGRGWWDKPFTNLLVDCLPEELDQLVQYGCGSGEAATALLPLLPNTHYVGIESDAALFSPLEARLLTSPIADRISLHLAPPLELPLPNSSAGAVLSVMALQHCTDVRALLHEVERVLRPGGCLLAVEPDNLGQRFYFDGALEDLTNAVRHLSMRARVALQPADIAVGPRIPSMVKRAGFAEIRMQHHTIGGARMETAKAFCDRAARICERIAIASDLSPGSPELQAARDAIRRFQFAGLPKRLGFSAHVIPVFVCRATTLPAG